MDPESKDKPNESPMETSESPLESSPVNSSSLKESVKKVLEVNSKNEDECAMEVDTDEQASSNKCSETKNGVSEENKSSEIKNVDSENNSDKVTSNHEQNDKDSPADSVHNVKSDSAIENKPGEEKKADEPKIDNDADSKTNSQLDDSKKDSESNGLIDTTVKPTNVEASTDQESSKSENSSKSDSANDNVRPAEKSAKISSESVESESPASKSPKTESSDKEAKDSSSLEIPNEAATTSKENKSKETADNPPTEAKPESTKKEGESKKKKSKTCEECGVKKGLKFQVLFKGKTRFLCSDTCFKNFKSKQMQSKPATEAPAEPAAEKLSDKCAQCQKSFSGDQKFYPVVGDTKPLCSEDCMKKYQSENIPHKNCSQCKKVIENPQNPEILTWETMVFCNEDCLGKYQSYLGSHCTCCQSPVPQASLGKYSVCFGADIRQFCSCGCLDDFKKNLKVCSFCQTDLSAGIDSFLAPVGDKGQFKDFCSQNCMERYEVMNNISKNTPEIQVCSHCKKQGTYKIQAKRDNQTYALCSDLCVAGFRCSHNIKDKMCYTCFNFFEMSAEKDKEFSFKFDSQFKQFCTKACMTLFVLSHRKIVACVSCKVKKYNFDMIEKVDSNNQTQIFCSLNCLSLYRVSMNATSSKSVRCDNCSKNLPAQYHLTMSDGSVRNFCTYNCVMAFQSQYTNVCTMTTSSATRQTSSTISTSTSKTSSATSSPVISNVVSLAPATPRVPGAPTLIRNIVPPKIVPARQPLQPVAIIGSKIFSLAPSTRVVTPVLTHTVTSKPDVVQQSFSTLLVNSDSKSSSTIASPSPLTTITNASGQQVIREVIVKPSAPKSQKNKSVACKPIMQNKGINVKPQPCHKAVQTDDSPKQILVPVPVPYYVPVPVHMYSRPVPTPMPFPVPVFVPIVMPPKDALNQGKTSSISGEKSNEKKPEESFNNVKDGAKEESSSHKENNKDNNDNSEPAPPAADDFNDANDYEDDEYVFKDGKNHHHGKRHASSHHKNKGRKKSRADDTGLEESKTHNTVSAEENRNSSIQNDHLEPAPRLKHMFGVNAWKQWVLQKNEQMERGSHSSRKFKLFKTDLLQLPPDELNYSLSLFVKEVRKPNGEEYGSGSIYYLCLGIQKYLYQNGRIDNIFSDPYYEKFTECLNDILLSQDQLNLMEGFPASRIEEDVLWEAKQLGAHSPYALLNTVLYFNTKFFKLKSVDEHMKLSFNHLVTVFDRKATDKPEKIGVLRYYYNGRRCDYAECNHNTSMCLDAPRKDPKENKYKEIENSIDSMKCPVRLFEFYLSKCPENCKGRNDMFYLHPERSCVPDSATWYSVQPLGHDLIAKMVQRIKLVREIYEE